MSQSTGLVNLNIVRARHAVRSAKSATFGGVNGGEIAKKIPPLIMNNGLIAVLSFACEKGEKTGYANVFEEVIKHFKDENVRILPPDSKISKIEDLLAYILEHDTVTLRLMTIETMRWLEYFRRFAKKGEIQ